MKNRIRVGLYLVVMLVGSSRFIAKAGIIGPYLLSQNRIPDMSVIGLPPGAIELKLDLQFPEAQSDPFLSQPEAITAVSDHQLCISDMVNNELYLFDRTGKFMRRFGRSGQGPGDLLRPASIAFDNDRIIVREAGNMRFQFFSMTGQYLDGFKAFRGYTDFAAFKDRIYATPFLIKEPGAANNEQLVDILDFKGRRVGSFGSPLEVNPHDFPWLNQAILAIKPSGELWVVFRCFPIVRRYSLNGTSLAEYHFRTEITDRKESYNKQNDLERTQTSSQPFYAYIAHAACATNRGLYLIDSTAGQRLIIIYLNNNGRLEEYYWFPMAKRGFACTGLIVEDVDAEKRFYVLDASEACVSVYSIR